MATATLGEAGIRRLLVRHLRATGEAAGARVLTELCIAGFSRRADVVLVNGRLSAFEIKGERDDLDRLPGQIATYARYFERVIVVCAPRHTAGALAAAPPEIGVWEASAAGLAEVRAAAGALQPDRDAWLSYLPVRELAGLLSGLGIRPAGRRRDQLLAAAQAVPVDGIRQAALRYLKSPERAARLREAKASRGTGVDPVEQQRLRVQEFLDMVSAGGGAMKAIPRRKAAIRI